MNLDLQVGWGALAEGGSSRKYFIERILNYNPPYRNNEINNDSFHSQPITWKK